MLATEHIHPALNEPGNRTRIRAVSLTTEWVVLGIFVAALAWVPFWFGSNRLIAWGINGVVFAGLAAIYELTLLIRGLPHPIPLRQIRLSAALFGAVVVWILVQNASWVPAGWQHPIWQLASEVLNRPLSGRISVDPDLSVLALIRLMTAASALWLALQLSRDAMRARALIWSIIVISAAYAAAGLFALGFLPGGVIFSEMGKSTFVSSTFLNRNNYATFAGIGFIAAAATILKLYRQEFAQTGPLLRLKVATLIETTGTKSAIPLGLAAVILAALLLSGSRGAIISTTLGLFVLVVSNMGRTKRSGRNEALLAVFAALLVGVAFLAFGDIFVGRIESVGIYDENRLLGQIVTAWSILASPLLGYGYGTFAAAFPMFRDDTASVWGFWDKAHATYLEVFQGLGLVFGAMLIASVVVLIWNCLKGAKTRRRDATIPAIAASASFLVGVHALVDFSLQIQAVTLTYFAVLGAGVAQATEPSSTVQTRAQVTDALLTHSRSAGHMR